MSGRETRNLDQRIRARTDSDKTFCDHEQKLVHYVSKKCESLKSENQYLKA